MGYGRGSSTTAALLSVVHSKMFVSINLQPIPLLPSYDQSFSLRILAHRDSEFESHLGLRSR